MDGGDLEVLAVAHKARATSPHPSVVTTSGSPDGTNVFEGPPHAVGMRYLPRAGVVAKAEQTRIGVAQGILAIRIVSPRAARAATLNHSVITLGRLEQHSLLMPFDGLSKVVHERS